MEVKVHLKNLDISLPAEDSKATESTKETTNKLINNLRLLGIQVKIGKYGIMEPQNKDLNFSIYPSIFR